MNMCTKNITLSIKYETFFILCENKIALFFIKPQKEIQQTSAITRKRSVNKYIVVFKTTYSHEQYYKRILHNALTCEGFVTSTESILASSCDGPVVHQRGLLCQPKHTEKYFLHLNFSADLDRSLIAPVYLAVSNRTLARHVGLMLDHKILKSLQSMCISLVLSTIPLVFIILHFLNSHKD